MNLQGFWVVPVVFALAACGDTKPPGDVPPVDGSVVTAVDLGTGQLYWEPLAATGTHVELIHGPQGGYHIFGRVRFTAPTSDVYVGFRVTPTAGGAALNDPTERLHLVEGRGLMRTATGWESTSALLVVLVNIRGPAEVVGRAVRFETTITPSPATPETPSAAASREVLVVDKT
ncbi:MAG: hypothetical protein U0326_14330 [Polyangiales bacterium]